VVAVPVVHDLRDRGSARKARSRGLQRLLRSAKLTKKHLGSFPRLEAAPETPPVVAPGDAEPAAVPLYATNGLQVQVEPPAPSSDFDPSGWV